MPIDKEAMKRSAARVQPAGCTRHPGRAPHRLVIIVWSLSIAVMAVFAADAVCTDQDDRNSGPGAVNGQLAVLVVDWLNSAPLAGAEIILFDGAGGRFKAKPMARDGWYLIGGMRAGLYPSLVVRREGYVTDILKNVKVLEAGMGSTAAVMLVRSSAFDALPWQDLRRLEALALARAQRRSQMEEAGYEFDDEGNVIRAPDERMQDLEAWESGGHAQEVSDGAVTLTVKGRKVSSTVESALKLRSDMPAASDITTEKEIKKTGDSTAGDAMRRVVGVSLVGGKYVYVRGLGERYSLTLFNNAYLPTPEPDRRVVPLDLFPTAMIDRIVVSKTYTPDLPGDFAGGTVQIFAKTIPAGRSFSAGISTGIDEGTTGRAFDTYRGGKTDWLGYDSGARRMPSRVPSDEKVVAAGLLGGMDDERLRSIGVGFNNNWRVNRITAPPDAGVSASISEKSGGIGIFANAMWKESWELDEFRRITWKNEGTNLAPKLTVKNDYDFRESTFKAMISGMAMAGWQIDGYNELNARLFYVHSGTDSVRIYEGLYNDTQADILTTSIEWTERSLTHLQLSGTHRGPSPVFDASVLGDESISKEKEAREGRLDWRVTLSLSSSDSPDRKQIRYDMEEVSETWVWREKPGTNQRDFFTLSEWMAECGLDWQVPFTALGRAHSFKTGLMVLNRDRHFRARTFQYRPRGNPMTSTDGQVVDFYWTDPEALFNERTIWPGGWVVAESTRATDEYTARNLIAASYLMGVFNLSAEVMLNAGVRIEYCLQSIATFDPFSPDKSRVEASTGNLDILPGLNARWRFARGYQTRVSLSRTVNRPEFRELAEFEFTDVMGEYAVKGNPSIQRATVTNLDVRVETFPGPGEVAALSVFYKHFESPIERILQATTEFRISFANARSAQNFGIEAELRLGLRHLHEHLNSFEFVFNASFIESIVDLSELHGMQTSKRRALQGQSPYLVNAMISWSAPESYGLLDGVSVSLAYNSAGRRISSVGAAGLPDTYEEASHDLKLILAMKLPGGGSFSLEFANLLLHYPKYTQGDLMVQEGKGSMQVKAGFSWSF